jgi:hypothetical protein
MMTVGSFSHYQDTEKEMLSSTARYGFQFLFRNSVLKRFWIVKSKNRSSGGISLIPCT